MIGISSVRRTLYHGCSRARPALGAGASARRAGSGKRPGRCRSTSSTRIPSRGPTTYWRCTRIPNRLGSERFSPDRPARNQVAASVMVAFTYHDNSTSTFVTDPRCDGARIDIGGGIDSDANRDVVRYTVKLVHSPWRGSRAVTYTTVMEAYVGPEGSGPEQGSTGSCAGLDRDVLSVVPVARRPRSRATPCGGATRQTAIRACCCHRRSLRRAVPPSEWRPGPCTATERSRPMSAHGSPTVRPGRAPSTSGGRAGMRTVSRCASSPARRRSPARADGRPPATCRYRPHRRPRSATRARPRPHSLCVTDDTVRRD